MATLYVRQNGNDNNPGNEVDSAFGTIRAAVAASAPDDTIDIGPGEFVVTEAVEIPHGLTIQGASIEDTVVRGCVDYDHQFRALSEQGVAGLTFRDMTLDVANEVWDYAGRRTCIRVERVSDLLIERVRFLRPSAWAVVVGCGTPASGTSADHRRAVNHRVTVRRCDFVGLRPQEHRGFSKIPRGSTLEQLLIFNTRTVLVEDCTFRDIPPSASGLGLYQVVRGVTVRRCTFDGAGVGAYYPITGREILFEFCRFFGGAGIYGARETDNKGLHGTSEATRDLQVRDCHFECWENAAALEIGAVRGARVSRCTFVGCLGPSIVINRGRDLKRDKSVRAIGFACDDVQIEDCVFFDAGRYGDFPRLHGAVYIARHHGSTLHGFIRACRFERRWRPGHDISGAVQGPMGFPWLIALSIENGPLAPDEIDNGGTIRGFAIIDSDLRPASVEFADGSNLEVENVTELWGFLPDNNAP